MSIKEKGVWIVYDLKANRKIQELLTKNEFAFRFDPSLEIEKKKTLAEVSKVIDEKIKEYEKYWLDAHKKEDKQTEDIFYNTYANLEKLKLKLKLK